jgi:hypothetical protein
VFEVLGLPIEAQEIETREHVTRVVVLLEVEDLESNSKSLRLNSSTPLSVWELLGMLHAAVLVVETDMRDSWADGD